MNEIIPKKAPPEMQKLAQEMSFKITEILESFMPDTDEDAKKSFLVISTTRSVLLHFAIHYSHSIGMKKSTFLAHANILWDTLEEEKEKENEL